MSINWYPGHMVKAKREIEENLKLVDIVAVLLDARAPFSCRNPELERMLKRKKTIMILNKMDLADPAATARYREQFQSEDLLTEAMDSLGGKGAKEVLQALKTAYKPVEEDLLRRGRRVRPARVMVVGVPNIGKSTFLNCLAGRKLAKTGAKPGITRGKQWIRVREDVEFLDTPGLMWPKISIPEQGMKLALLDIVGENAYSEEEVALYLLDFLKSNAPEIITTALKLDNHDQPVTELLDSIARKRGHLLKGGYLDTAKTCKSLLLDFRKGNLGRISLDKV
ncbi:MAG TPA: ribosome biogenesis GTPase YlqF [Syntrophomonadaceae bacterium]|nr:ribosome biogenesis GTPase YlqF [Syntrophomonadaceae bacterium]